MKNVAVLTEDGAFALFFRPRRGGFDSSRVPTTPGNFPSKAKKIQMPGCQCLGVSPDVCVCVGAGGGGGLGATGIDWYKNLPNVFNHRALQDP